MQQEQLNIISQRVERLAPQIEDKEFREAYLASDIDMFLALQIRAMRGDKSQDEFAKLLGKTQNTISRLEDPDYTKSIKSLLDIAHANKVALLVKFVDYATYLKETSDISNLGLTPLPYCKDMVSKLVVTKSQVKLQNTKTNNVNYNDSLGNVSPPDTYLFLTSGNQQQNRGFN